MPSDWLVPEPEESPPKPTQAQIASSASTPVAVPPPLPEARAPEPQRAKVAPPPLPASPTPATVSKSTSLATATTRENAAFETPHTENATFETAPTENATFETEVRDHAPPAPVIANADVEAAASDEASGPSSSMPSSVAIATPEHDPFTADAAVPLRRARQRTQVAALAAILLVGGTIWGTLRKRSAPRSEGPLEPSTTVRAAMRVEPPSAAVVSAAPAVTVPPSIEPTAQPTAMAEPATSEAAPAAPPAAAPSAPSSNTEMSLGREVPHTKKPALMQPAEKPTAGTSASKMDRPPETELPDPSVSPARSPKSNVDEDALQQALAQAAQRAKGCHVEGGPTGSVRVSITFSPSGDVTGATAQGAAFSNTVEGDCIAAKFRALHIPPFSGTEFVAKKTVAIE